jgi:hypothetical protein
MIENGVSSLDYMEYLAYMPLFLSIHADVIANPLQMPPRSVKSWYQPRWDL